MFRTHSVTVMIAKTGGKKRDLSLPIYSLILTFSAMFIPPAWDFLSL